VTGMYLGDPSFNPSTSSPVNFTITQAPTTAVVAVSAQFQGATLSATVNTNSGGSPPSGTVTFFVNGTAVGSSAAATEILAVTSLTGSLQGAQAIASYTDTALTNGTAYTVKAMYQGDTNYLSSTSSSIGVTLQSDFFLSPSEELLGITAPGSSGSLTLTVGALDGYTGTIAFSSTSCSGLPAGAKCSFSPSSIAGGGTTTLTVTTTAATAATLRPSNNHGLGWWATLSTTGLAGLVWLGIPTKRRRSFHLLALLFCALIVAGVGCGGGSAPAPTPAPPPAPTPTPAGSYTVTVTATSGPLKHSVSFALNVE